MIKAIVTDGMEMYVRVRTENGSLVNGHYSRCMALMHEWDKIVYKRGVPKRHVIVYDGTTDLYDLQDDDLAVGILDMARQNKAEYDVIVAHHPGAYLFDLDERYDHQLKLLGPEYLLLRPEYKNIMPYTGEYIAYVPGGNHQTFWNNIGDISNRYPGIIVENYAPSESAKLIAYAGMVVCSASTVALEAMALGKRILMTVTADDQRPIVDGLEWLGYKNFLFSTEKLKNWHDLSPIQLGNRFSGVITVAKIIYREANR